MDDHFLRGEYELTKDELKGSALTENEILALHLRSVERRHNLKENTLGYYFRRELKTHIRFYWCEHGHPEFVEQDKKALLKLYKGKSLNQ